MIDKSVEDVLNLPDYDEIKNKFTGKYKDDIIVKYDDSNINNNKYRCVHILYKKEDGKYIGMIGTVAQSIINTDTIDDIVVEYEKAMEEFIDKTI